MFCSKCGKELNEGAVFCDKCGNKTGAVLKEESAKEFISEKIPPMSEKEKSSKISAVIAFLIEHAVIIGMLISLISSKFTTASAFIDCGSSSLENLKEALTALYERTFEPWSWAVILLVIGSFIFVLLKFYAVPFIKRSFRANMKNLHKFTGLGELLFLIYMVLIGGAVLSDSDYKIGIGFYILAVLLIAAHWTVMILYRKASDNEPDFEKIKFDESLKSDGKWQCRKCGSYNPVTIQNCRDCGTYK